MWRDLRNDLPDNFVRGDPFTLGGKVGRDSMPQNGRSDRRDVLTGNVDFTVQEGVCLRGEDQTQTGPRTCAKAQILCADLYSTRFFRPGGANDCFRVAIHMICDRNGSNYFLNVEYFFGGKYRFGLLSGGARPHLHDLQFFLIARVADFDEEHEAIELCFGERISSFLFEWILSREDEERVGQIPGNSADGYFPFLHCFQHGGLSLGRCAVNLIGQNDVGEKRSGQESELFFAGGRVLKDDLGSGDVARHQVGGELDAAERHLESFGEGGDEEGFGEAGDADEEGVAAGKNGDEDFVDDVGLADDDFGEFALEGGVAVGGELDGVWGIWGRGVGGERLGDGLEHRK